MTDLEQKKKAKEFAEFWKDKGYEKGQSQIFWTTLLTNVFGVENISEFIEFEDQVHIDKTTGFIDGYIPSTKVLIEQKSIEKDLRKPIKQSDGSLLNPFQQAKKYIAESISDAEDKSLSQARYQINAVKRELNDEQRKLIREVDKEIDNLDALSDSTSSLKNEIRKFINKLNNTMYGAV